MKKFFFSFFIENKKMNKTYMFVFTAFAVKHKPALRYFLFLFIFKMLLQLHQSPPVVNSVDWSVYIRSHRCQCTSEHEPSMKSKGLSADI